MHMVKMRLYDEELKLLVTEVIKLLCRKRMSFESKLCVEGLVGVTIDEDNVFWVKIDDSCNKESFNEKFPSQCKKLLHALEKALEACDNTNCKGRNASRLSNDLCNEILNKAVKVDERTANTSLDLNSCENKNSLQYTNGDKGENFGLEAMKPFQVDNTNIQRNTKHSQNVISVPSLHSAKTNPMQTNVTHSDSINDSPVNLGSDVVITENRSEEYSLDDLNMREDTESANTGNTTPVDLRCISAEPEGVDAPESESLVCDDDEHDEEDDDDDEETGMLEAEDLSLPKRRNDHDCSNDQDEGDSNDGFGISDLPGSPGGEASALLASQGNTNSSSVGMSMANPLFRYNVPPQFGLGHMALGNPFTGAVNAAMGVGIPLQVPSIMHRMAQSKSSTNRSSYTSNLFSPQPSADKSRLDRSLPSSSDLTNAAANLAKQKALSSTRAKTPASLAESMSGTESHKCANCGTTKTTVWRRDDAFRIVCNACGLYFRLHKRNRPVHWAGKDIATRRRKKNSPFSPSQVASSPRQSGQSTTPIKGPPVNPMVTLQQMLSSSPVASPNYYSARASPNYYSARYMADKAVALGGTLVKDEPDDTMTAGVKDDTDDTMTMASLKSETDDNTIPMTTVSEDTGKTMMLPASTAQSQTAAAMATNQDDDMLDDDDDGEMEGRDLLINEEGAQEQA